MRDIQAPSFVQQADAQLLRVVGLDLKPSQKSDFDSLVRRKHQLILEEAKFLQEITAWADMAEADVIARKAHEEALAKTNAYAETMRNLNTHSAVKVTEVVAAESADHPTEEAA
jgi:sugar diacid utilization regulator